MKEVTADQMREIDRIMEEELHVSVTQMMEDAARVIARAAYRLFNPKNVVFLCGKGHNGGDGIAAARHLHNMGVTCSVVLASKELKGIPLQQLALLKEIGVPINDTIDNQADLIVDCLLGYSAKGAPRGRVSDLIIKANQMGVPILSIDIPTGFDVTENKWHEPSFKDVTVLTLALPKVNMINNPNIKKLYVADIGVMPEAFKRIGIDVGIMFKDKDYVEAR